MENLLIILGVLLVGVIVMVNLAKWTAPENPGPLSKKLSRWFFPLLALIFLIQIIAHYVR